MIPSSRGKPKACRICDKSSTSAGMSPNRSEPIVTAGTRVTENAADALPAPLANPARRDERPRLRATLGVTTTSPDPVSTIIVKGPYLVERDLNEHPIIEERKRHGGRV